MPTQYIAALNLGATCCVRLATLLRHVATCWVLLAQIWPFSNLSQQHPTCRNTSQHGGQTHTTCCFLACEYSRHSFAPAATGETRCFQQCWDLLRWHKGPFTRAIFVAATRCNFCRALTKLQLQNRTCKPAAIFTAICRSDIAGVSNMFETWCNFGATKIASSCRDKNRLCKQAFNNNSSRNAPAI